MALDEGDDDLSAPLTYDLMTLKSLSRSRFQPRLASFSPGQSVSPITSDGPVTPLRYAAGR
jgi:hypothetical protein